MKINEPLLRLQIVISGICFSTFLFFRTASALITTIPFFKITLRKGSSLEVAALTLKFTVSGQSITAVTLFTCAVEWATTPVGGKSLGRALDAAGNPVWTDACKAEEHPQMGRGMTSGGFYGIFDFNSYVGWQSDAMQRTYETITPYATVPNYYPSMVGKYNETEQATIDAYGAAYQTFVKGELVKFLLGGRDLSEWDAFVQEATTTYHGADLVAVSQSAWDRANAG